MLRTTPRRLYGVRLRSKGATRAGWTNYLWISPTALFPGFEPLIVCAATRGGGPSPFIKGHPILIVEMQRTPLCQSPLLLRMRCSCIPCPVQYEKHLPSLY
ncbi:hypothetical protein BDV18DRAFT_140684 [Aspergillus unguis]